MTIADTPIYYDLLTPELQAAMTRPRWSYATALAAADAAIAARSKPRKRKAAKA